MTDETQEAEESTGRQTLSFWKELYGFVAVSLLGLLIVLWFIPPSARQHWSLLQHEADLRARNAFIQEEIAKLRQATLAFETDPFYRESAIRERLGIKSNTESYLDDPRPVAPPSTSDDSMAPSDASTGETGQ